MARLLILILKSSNQVHFIYHRLHRNCTEILSTQVSEINVIWNAWLFIERCFSTKLYLKPRLKWQYQPTTHASLEGFKIQFDLFR
jgi:hypothetical protein